MIFNEFPPIDSLASTDSVNNYTINDSVQGKWSGQYSDYSRRRGWIEFELHDSDSLLTGTITFIQQEIHGQTKSTGVISGKYEAGLLKLTAQFKSDVKIILTGMKSGFSGEYRFLGCYDSTPSNKSFNVLPLVTSGTWEVYNK